MAEVTVSRLRGLAADQCMQFKVGAVRKRVGIGEARTMSFPESTQVLEVQVLAPVARYHINLAPQQEDYRVNFGGVSADVKVSCQSLPDLPPRAVSPNGKMKRLDQGLSARAYLEQHWQDLQLIQDVLGLVTQIQPACPLSFIASYFTKGVDSRNPHVARTALKKEISTAMSGQKTWTSTRGSGQTPRAYLDEHWDTLQSVQDMLQKAIEQQPGDLLNFMANYFNKVAGPDKRMIEKLHMSLQEAQQEADCARKEGLEMKNRLGQENVALKAALKRAEDALRGQRFADVDNFTFDTCTVQSLNSSDSLTSLCARQCVQDMGLDAPHSIDASMGRVPSEHGTVLTSSSSGASLLARLYVSDTRLDADSRIRAVEDEFETGTALTSSSSGVSLLARQYVSDTRLDADNRIRAVEDEFETGTALTSSSSGASLLARQYVSDTRLDADSRILAVEDEFETGTVLTGCSSLTSLLAKQFALQTELDADEAIAVVQDDFDNGTVLTSSSSLRSLAARQCTSDAHLDRRHVLESATTIGSSDDGQGFECDSPDWSPTHRGDYFTSSRDGRSSAPA